MTNIVNLTFDNQSIELSELEDIGYRIQRLAFDTNKLSSSGGDFSTSFTLPKSKNNVKALKVTDEISSINKFNRLKAYIAILYINGQQVFKGIATLKGINKNGYQIEMKGENVEWIQLLDNIKLNRLGYTQDPTNPNTTIPTWLVPFNGGETINQLNDLDNQQTDIFFPTIVYNNTPKTDYFDFSSKDIFGIYNGTTQTSPAKDFPNILNCQTGYFGQRQGLTFEDFPPAVYYANLIKKCFMEIGWNATGEIFNTNWFNRLYIPYTNTGFYKYNWKTLGYLFANPQQRILPLFDVAGILNQADLRQPLIQLPNSFVGGLTNSYVIQNIPYLDNVTNRIDDVANFKKFLVTDIEQQISENSKAGYVCPADGRYRITVKSRFKKKLTKTIGSSTPLSDLAYVGSGQTGFGWDDNILVVTRQNQNGEYPLSDNVFEFVNKMTENISSLYTIPSDIIMYGSAKRATELTPTDIKTAGSPLSNFVEEVSVIDYYHQITIDTSDEKESESFLKMSVEIDLLKNERVHWYWHTLVQSKQLLNPNMVEFAEITLNDADENENTIVIEYLCGQEDLDIADNLPEITAKQLLSNFIRMFNLKPNVNIGSKTVDFAFISGFYTDPRSAFDITNRVDLSDGIDISPLDVPALLTIGYQNDEKDRLLFSNKALCLGEEQITGNYANVNQFENDNVYANGSMTSFNGFSATRFVEGQLFLTDIADAAFNPQRVILLSPAAGNPPFVQGIEYNSTNVVINPMFPSIQSETSFNQLRLQDLEYDYDYKLRILMNLGTVAAFEDNRPVPPIAQIYPTHRIKIDSPDYYRLEEDRFWIKPTISTFDVENFYTGSNPSIESTTSLRYDNGNLKGLYDLYFDDVIDTYNRSHLLELNVALRPYDWNQMQSNRLIKYKNDIYKLVSIKDYDPINANLAKVTLMKLV